MTDLPRAPHGRFTKTLSETDLVLFAGLTGDLHPVHIDESSPEAVAAGGRTVHSVFLIGLMSTAASRLAQAEGLRTRLRGFSNVEFLAPAHVGDTVTATAARVPEIAPGGAAPALGALVGPLQLAVEAALADGRLLAQGVALLELS